MNNDVLFSSKSDMWATPNDFFERINKEFHFDIDVCAISDNTKCEKFFTPEMDGLKQKWYGVCWCNPPYGKDVYKWVEKAYNSSLNGVTVVMLLPVRTDTKWFHDFIYNKAEIRYIKGRLKFNNSKNPAPFPSMIVIFKSNIK